MTACLPRMLLPCLVTLMLAADCRADVPALMAGKGRKILFLGDSNTYAGLYIAYLEGYLRTRYPAEEWDLINLGLPSETLSGLSEPDHPYPRPDIHQRVDRALTRIKPNVVFVCYGMNDGIYYPFSVDRLAKYKEGTESLVAKIEKAGAKVILMTPAPFDGTPIAKNLLTKDAAKFSWMKPYQHYDAEVLRRYADYLLEWRKKDYVVVDAHAAVHRFLKAMRAQEPGYVISGDGIHPNPTGHAAIAFEILRELKAPGELADVEIDAKARKVVKGDNVKELKIADAMTFTNATKFPMPEDSRWHQRLNEIDQYHERFNRQTIKVTGLADGTYDAFEVNANRKLATFTHAELAKGVSLSEQLIDKRSHVRGEILRKRQQVLGLAWLTDIGHERPGTPKGMPLDEARKQAAALERDLRQLGGDVGEYSYRILIRKSK